MHLAIVDVSQHHAHLNLTFHILTELTHKAGWSSSLHGTRDPPPHTADVIGIHLHSILYAPNIPHILRTWDIPTRASDRTADHPLIIVGGQACAAPEPFAPFVDLVYLGEAEAGLCRLLETIARSPRSSLLDRLADYPWAYLPDRKPHGTWITAPGPWPDPLPTDRHGTIIEIARGCPYRCTFCQTSRLAAPYRPASTWTEIPPGKLNLWSTSLATYPHAQHILSAAQHAGAYLRAGEARLSDLSPEVCDALAAAGCRHLALGIEGPTPQIRKRIGKPIGDDELAATLNDISRTIPFLRIGMIPGLPGHGPAETARFAQWLRHWLPTRPRVWKGHPARVDIISTAFQAMPHTPLERSRWYGDKLLDHWTNTLLSIDAESYGTSWCKRTPMARIAFALHRTDRQFADLLDAMAHVRCREHGPSWNHNEIAKFYKLLDQLDLTLPLYPNQIVTPAPWSTVTTISPPGRKTGLDLISSGPGRATA